MRITILRFLKTTFIRLHLHNIFGWLNGLMENLLWMNRLSRWAASNHKQAFNDFPSRWDYTKRFSLYSFIIENEKLDQPVNYLEFGVAQGFSFQWWMQQNSHPDSRFYGFDTFTGLPEDFGSYKKGTFNNGHKPPAISDQRGRFFQGLFQQTLPGFLKGFNNRRKTVVMLDADLYTATIFALTSLAPHLKPGDIILFDEFVVPTHEFKAYHDFISSYYLPLEFIGAANNYYFAAFRVGKV